MLLEHASMLAQVTAPDVHADIRAQLSGTPARAKIDRQELIESFLDAGLRETDALLMVWGEMLGDEGLHERVRRDVRARRHPLPRWLLHLDEVRPTRIIELSHILGDGENVFIGVETPGRSFTIVLYIDHNVGTLPKDGFVVDLPVQEVVARNLAEDLPDMTLTELLLEDGRAKIAEALANEAILIDPYETDSWPGVRPLTEWMLRLLPAGGTGYEHVERTEEEMDEIVADFLASPFAEGLSSDAADHVNTLLNFAGYYGGGDPLRWSNVVVEVVLLDLIPRKVIADEEYLAGVPGTLRALVRYAHDRRGVPESYTRDATEAIDEIEEEYLELIAEPHPYAGALGGLLEDPSGSAYWLRRLAQRVGGDEQLESISLDPLPDEPLDIARVPEAARDAVVAVAELVDRTCTDFFENVELRTAARRLLVRIAQADPVALGRGKAANAASAVCWIIARATDQFEIAYPGARVFNVKDMTAFLGVKSTPNDRALTLLSALGVDYYGEWEFTYALGDAALLTSSTRATIARNRDFWRERDGDAAG